MPYTIQPALLGLHYCVKINLLRTSLFYSLVRNKHKTVVVRISKPFDALTDRTTTKHHLWIHHFIMLHKKFFNLFLFIDVWSNCSTDCPVFEWVWNVICFYIWGRRRTSRSSPSTIAIHNHLKCGSLLALRCMLLVLRYAHFLSNGLHGVCYYGWCTNRV